MKNVEIEPMAKTFSHVHTTTDYFLFKPIGGNRNKNLFHINRLKNSMAQNYLFTAIIVNENHQIIDGQHRFEVIKELGLPLHYIICNGYSLNEVHILNQNAKNWSTDDYLQGYCDLGYKDYLLYKNFKDQYGFGHKNCLALITGGKVPYEKFKSGEMVITNYFEATKIADNIMLVQPFYSKTGIRSRSFVNSMISLSKNPNFEFTEFLQKLKLQPLALVDCASTTQCKSLIEEIYNYRRREKVNLRF
jgi:hypothetical protein